MTRFEQRDGFGRVAVAFEYETAEGCGQVCTNYRGPVAPWAGEPSLDQLRRQALRELEAADRELGLDLPPRNPGLVEGGPTGGVWLVVFLALMLVLFVSIGFVFS